MADTTLRDPPRGTDAAAQGADHTGPRAFPAARGPSAGNLHEAARCELAARKLWSLVEEIREAIRLGDACLEAAAAIEDILECNRQLLGGSGKLMNHQGRGVLAAAFETMRRQIDFIAAEAGTEERNLALGDIISITFEESRNDPLQTPVMDLSAVGLGIENASGGFQSDADLQTAVVQIDRALERLRVNRTVLEMLLSVIRSREKLAMHKMVSLREQAWSLTARDNSLAAMHELVAQAGEGGASGSPAGGTDRLTANDNTAGDCVLSRRSLERARALINSLDRSSTVDALDKLSLELARSLDPDNDITGWVASGGGESRVFSRRLAAGCDSALTQAAAEKYRTDEAFRAYANEYVTLFESLVARHINSGPDDKENIEKLVKTDCGVVYAMLAKATGRL